MTSLLELAARLQAAKAPEDLLLLVAKATLILLIARLLLAAMPRASAAMKHAIATAALIAVAAMPIATMVMPVWHISTAAPKAARAQKRDVAREIGARDAEPETRGSTIGTAFGIARAVVPDEPLSVIDRMTNLVRGTWKGLVVISFGVGAFLMLVHMLAGMAGVWFVARKATPLEHRESLRELRDAIAQLDLRHDVRLLTSTRISVPVVWGIFRPVLMLPADVTEWPVERLRVVLLHELAHLKRYDGLSLLLTRAAVALFWFHPVAWSLERAGRSECERACDDLVLASGTKPSDYADHLLAIARSMPSFDPFRSVTLAMSRKTQLEGRLLSILQPHVVRRAFGGRAVGVACALAVAVIVPVAAVRLTAEPPKEQPKAAKSEITVTTTKADTIADEMDDIGDFLVAALGKYDKRADRWAKQPGNGEEWHERGWDYYRNDRYADAAAAFERAAGEQFRADVSLYNAACSHALAGHREQAVMTLKAAIAAGYDDYEHIAEDSDFDSLRGDPEFAKALDDSRGDIATRRLTTTLKRYDTLSRHAHRRSGEEWFDVGMDLLSLRKLDQSIDAFDNAINAGYKPATAMYNIACAHSLRGDARSGIAALDKAIESGFSSEDKLKSDSDIALLRKQPEFAALAQKAKDLELGGINFDIVGIDITNWKHVSERHKQMTQKYPNSGRAWFNVGYSTLQAGDFATAHDAFRRTIAMNYRVGTSSYNIACAYALQNNKDAAFEWLAKAKAANFELDDHLRHDNDLDSLHRDPRWKTFTAGLESH
jgi:beta-lactamase regulating signal transducer with metallopeptidase domain/tetratricopeptide (TPR) repeat protein